MKSTYIFVTLLFCSLYATVTGSPGCIACSSRRSGGRTVQSQPCGPVSCECNCAQYTLQNYRCSRCGHKNEFTVSPDTIAKLTQQHVNDVLTTATVHYKKQRARRHRSK